MRIFRWVVSACLFCFSADIASNEIPMWEIGSAVSQALKANRNFITGLESVERADLNLEYELSEYDWKVSPNSRLAYTDDGNGNGVKFAPEIGCDFSKKFMSGTKFFFSPKFSKMGKQVLTNMRAMITQPLFRGLGYWYTTARVQGASFQYRAAVRNMHVARVKLIVKVITSIYDIIKLEEVVRLNEESCERLGGCVTAARLKEKIGLSDSLDVYRAETELRHAEENLTNAQERLQEGYDLFRELLALPMDLPIKVCAPMQYYDLECDMDEAIQTALSYRIEIDQAQDNIYEQKRIVSWADQNLWPDLNLLLDYQVAKNRLGARFEDENGQEYFTYDWYKKRPNWTVGFSSQSDLHRSGEKLFYDNSLLAMDAAYRNMEQTEVNVTMEVKRALRTLKLTSKRIELQEEQIKTAEGELYLSQIKFSRGMANNFDVIQAEKNLRTAHIAYLSAVVDHINGEYQLKGVLGTLADKPCF